MSSTIVKVAWTVEDKRSSATTGQEMYCVLHDYQAAVLVLHIHFLLIISFPTLSPNTSSNFVTLPITETTRKHYGRPQILVIQDILWTGLGGVCRVWTIISSLEDYKDAHHRAGH